MSARRGFKMNLENEGVLCQVRSSVNYVLAEGVRTRMNEHFYYTIKR